MQPCLYTKCEKALVSQTAGISQTGKAVAPSLHLASKQLKYFSHSQIPSDCSIYVFNFQLFHSLFLKALSHFFHIYILTPHQIASIKSSPVWLGFGGATGTSAMDGDS